MAVAYVLDELFLQHRPPTQHPERPERLIAVRDGLRAAGLDARGAALPIRRAEAHELGRAHTAGYLDDLARALPGKSGWLDGDTYFSPDSYDAACAAAGAAVDVTLAALDGAHPRGLAIVRPPGHHAEADQAMGFCLLNNAAIAAAAARAAGARRVAVLDWDVHHGNGTQHIFYADPDVMYLSVHQWPFYPGSGAADEVGIGPGIGATVNVPLPAGCGDTEYEAAFTDVLVPALRRHRPDVILVSAGFDPFVDDPLAGMRVSVAGFRRMAELVRAAADELCEGRMACVLEGGYDLRGLGGGMAALLDVLAGQGTPAPAGAAAEANISAPGRAAIARAVAAQRAAVARMPAAQAAAT